MKNPFAFVPHLFTSGNLLCGVLAIIFIFEGEYITASYLVMLAAVLDFFDGFLARALKVTGEFGKQLDSLADVVTFGVVPALMYFTMARNMENWPFRLTQDFNQYSFLAYTPLLIAVFSALRLAKFNIDTRQSESFIGLPTPANTLMFIAFPFILESMPELGYDVLLNYFFVAGISLLSCFLLVSEIPMFSLKFKSYGLKENLGRYVFLFLALILIIVFKFAALAFVVVLYIVMSIIQNFRKNEVPSRN